MKIDPNFSMQESCKFFQLVGDETGIVCENHYKLIGEIAYYSGIQPDENTVAVWRIKAKTNLIDNTLNPKS